MKLNIKTKTSKSFTLLELLVVIAIIGLIASIAIVSTRGGVGRARIAKTLQYEASMHRYLGSDIVGWWKFDEGEGTIATDISGYNNHGTLVNNPEWVDGVPGKGGSALSFNGSNNYVNLGIFNEFPGLVGDNFTIGIWLQGDNVIKNTEYHFFGIGRNATGLNRAIGHRSINNQLTFFGHSANVHSNILPDNSWAGWNHWIITYNNNDVSFYRNGINIGIGSVSLNNLDNYQAYIGKSSYAMAYSL